VGLNYPKGNAAKYNGVMAKTDANTTRTKLKKFLNQIELKEYEE
jgi:hypothetical protein